MVSVAGSEPPTDNPVNMKYGPCGAMKGFVGVSPTCPWPCRPLTVSFPAVMEADIAVVLSVVRAKRAKLLVEPQSQLRNVPSTKN
jgi:hypothetical protein